MVKKYNSNAARIKRHRRVRAKISGTAATPRLNVFRSNTNIYAQIIDDVQGVTLVSASSLDKEIEGGGNKAAARQVGISLAAKAKEKGITEVVFDRGGHGVGDYVRVRITGCTPATLFGEEISEG